MKKFIIGVVVGAFLATAGTAAASTIIEKVTASVRTDYTIELDGKKLKLEKAPLAYEGSAYIAVREISTVIGKEVGFDNGVIKINTRNLDDGYQSLGGTPVDELHPNLIVPAIDAAKGLIKMHKMGLSSLSEEEQAAKQVEIDKLEQRLAELEDRKADLEAQQ